MPRIDELPAKTYEELKTSNNLPGEFPFMVGGVTSKVNINELMLGVLPRIDAHAFGAKGDTIGANDGTVTNGNTLTSTGYAFIASDVGKLLFINGTTEHTITSVSGNSAIFTPTRPNASAQPWLMGSDDTTAIQNAINFAHSYQAWPGDGESRAAWGGPLFVGGVVQLRAGRGYMVSNTQASYDGGKLSCLQIPMRTGLVGGGIHQTQIYVRPSAGVGHVIANKNCGTGAHDDFILLSDFTVMCNGGFGISGQLDGIRILIHRDNNYIKIDPVCRVMNIVVQEATQDGFHVSGRGENFYFNLYALFCFRYGIHPDDTMDSTFMLCNAGGNKKAGFRVNMAAESRFIGCKSFYSGQNGGSSQGDCANWWITADQAKNGLCRFTSCDAQESRGSSFVIESGINIFNGCFAGDPAREGLNSGTLPTVRAGFHLSGHGCRNNVFSDCLVSPSVGIWITTNNWGLALNAVHIDGLNGSNQGPQANRGNIWTYQQTVGLGGTEVGIQYNAGGQGAGANKGGTGTSNQKNMELKVDNVACT